MHSARVAVIYEPDGGRPLTVAQVGDRRLLAAVAQAAIAEADEQAEALTEADALLGAMHREEAARLRRVLGILVPEVRGERRLSLVDGQEKQGDA